jgi:hypothetical protein
MPSNRATFYLERATCFGDYDHHQAINTVYYNKVKMQYTHTHTYIYIIYIYIYIYGAWGGVVVKALRY